MTTERRPPHQRQTHEPRTLRMLDEQASAALFAGFADLQELMLSRPTFAHSVLRAIARFAAEEHGGEGIGNQAERSDRGARLVRALQPLSRRHKQAKAGGQDVRFLALIQSPPRRR